MSVTKGQHMQALERANFVRSERADLKRRMKAGETDAASVLSQPLPDWLETMRFGELLEAMPFIGPSKTYQYLAEIGNLSYTRRLNRLTTRQKFALVALLVAKEKDLERQRGFKKRARTKVERGVR
jgi:hypothetical protein